MRSRRRASFPDLRTAADPRRSSARCRTPGTQRQVSSRFGSPKPRPLKAAEAGRVASSRCVRSGAFGRYGLGARALRVTARPGLVTFTTSGRRPDVGKFGARRMDRSGDDFQRMVGGQSEGNSELACDADAKQEASCNRGRRPRRARRRCRRQRRYGRRHAPACRRHEGRHASGRRSPTSRAARRRTPGRCAGKGRQPGGADCGRVRAPYRAGRGAARSGEASFSVEQGPVLGEMTSEQVRGDDICGHETANVSAATLDTAPHRVSQAREVATLVGDFGPAQRDATRRSMTADEVARPRPVLDTPAAVTILVGYGQEGIAATSFSEAPTSVWISGGRPVSTSWRSAASRRPRAAASVAASGIAGGSADGM